jgi:hypothetical protein
LAIGHVP